MKINIIDVMETWFGIVPEQQVEAVRQTEDLNILHALLHEAAVVKSLEHFAERATEYA